MIDEIPVNAEQQKDENRGEINDCDCHYYGDEDDVGSRGGDAEG